MAWYKSAYTRKTDPLHPEDAGSDEDTLSLSDEELTKQAKSGDSAAFGELIRRHRIKACRLARSIAQDEFLAEDIVQEALVRAFLHVASLSDPQRFLPWFHRIVRNQALMKVRRGGIYAKELPLSSWEGHIHASVSSSGEDEWRDIERILYRISQSAARRDNDNDPSEYWSRKETIESIRGLLLCLGPKEREIFDAFFFRQLNPSEITPLFHTSTANVYNHIANAKRKVKQERLRVHISLYVGNRRHNGLPRARTLAPPPY
ncbi:hypothetical protein PCCS19_39400 [Paenibacillus sp. CCS19]|uniref:RNA polymerase sigma factor n=1 Tax=Paenibacillus sp. CCS19 TaxID=3158387 RepID=UPI0025637885|nr:sigma-70 family RNA polymerase sigma factor [Paenibacillus cellulosilyticus]GMK40884.1 hypothetical protein PCCS19_39400 [Paenibacillus cellulosilyticus]